MNPHNRRERLTADILAEMRTVVNEEIADSPKPVSLQDGKVLEDEIAAYTRHVLTALSIPELTSERALVSHLSNVREETKRLIRDRHPASAKEVQ